MADAGLRLIRRATAATRMRRPRSRRHELMAQLNVSHRLAKKRVLPPHLFRAIFFSRASCGNTGTLQGLRPRAQENREQTPLDRLTLCPPNGVKATRVVASSGERGTFAAY